LRHLKKLGYSKKSDIWASHLLIEKRVAACINMLNKLKIKPFLYGLVTREMKCVKKLQSLEALKHHLSRGFLNKTEVFLTNKGIRLLRKRWSRMTRKNNYCWHSMYHTTFANKVHIYKNNEDITSE
ncbi:hypothetical protein WH47_01676, partial [Habropoda laboriosa]